MSAATGDTNVLAAGFVGDPSISPPAAFLDAWRRRWFTLVLSEHILTELSATFALPYFRRRLTALEVEANLGLLRQRAHVVPITAAVSGVAAHPEDDLVLATAVSGQVDYLVTGDHELQELRAYQGVVILGPRQFVDAVLPRLQSGPSGSF